MSIALPASVELRFESGVTQCRVVSDGEWHDLSTDPLPAPPPAGEFAHPAPGALARPLISRFNEGRVSLFDFMTASQISDYQSRSAALDHTLAAQTALDSGEPVVEFPSGLLSLKGEAGLTVTTSGQHVRGFGAMKSYIATPTTDDAIEMLRVAAARVRISDLLFRPQRPADLPLRVYSGECEIDHNRFLGASGGSPGPMIVLTDVDPITSSFVPGAYSHWIHMNMCGSAGYAPLFFVKTEGTAGGQNDNRYENNRVWADRPFFLHGGGGIVVRGNKLQSATGTLAAKVGVGVDCQGAIGVYVSQNYFELYSIGINIRVGASDIRDMGDNHWDNVASETASAVGAPKLKRAVFAEV